MIRKKLVCVDNITCERYITIGKVYDVIIRENGDIAFINDYGVADAFHIDMLDVYFSDYIVYRNNLIEDILS